MVRYLRSDECVEWQAHFDGFEFVAKQLNHSGCNRIPLMIGNRLRNRFADPVRKLVCHSSNSNRTKKFTFLNSFTFAFLSIHFIYLLLSGLANTQLLTNLLNARIHREWTVNPTSVPVDAVFWMRSLRSERMMKRLQRIFKNCRLLKKDKQHTFF